MWNITDIKNELNRLSESVGDTFDIPVSINGRLTRTLGRVTQEVNRSTGYCRPLRMEFSRQFLETSTNESIKSVIGHEWSHYYTAKTTGENHGHDAVFKANCARVGCTEDKTTTKVDRTVSEESLHKYTVHCPTCNDTIGFYDRMCNTLKHLDQCTCTRCGGGNLTYTQNW